MVLQHSRHDPWTKPGGNLWAQLSELLIALFWGTLQGYPEAWVPLPAILSYLWVRAGYMSDNVKFCTIPWHIAQCTIFIKYIEAPFFVIGVCWWLVDLYWVCSEESRIARVYWLKYKTWYLYVVLFKNFWE